MQLSRKKLEQLIKDVEQLKCCSAGGGGSADGFVNAGVYDPNTQTLTLSNPLQPDVLIDLSTVVPGVDVFVNSAVFDANTGILTLADNSAGTPDILVDLSTINAKNLYNTDDTLTGDRILTGGGFSLTETGLSARTIDTTGDISLTSSTGAVNLTSGGGGITLSEPVEGSNLTITDEITLTSAVSTTVNSGATFDVNAGSSINLDTTATNPGGANIFQQLGTAGTALITTGGTNISTGTNAVLELASTTKGFLMPRMSTVDRIAIPTVAGDAGLRVYDTDTNSFWYWDGVQWVEGSQQAVAGGYAATHAFTANTPLTIPHALNSTDVIVQLKDPTGNLVIPDIVNDYVAGSVDIQVSVTGSYRVIIIKA